MSVESQPQARETASGAAAAGQEIQPRVNGAGKSAGAAEPQLSDGERLFVETVTRQLEHLCHQWRMKPCHNLCDWLVIDLKEVFLSHAMLVVGYSQFYEKKQKAWPLRSLVHSGVDPILKDAHSFIASVATAVPFAFISLPDQLIARLSDQCNGFFEPNSYHPKQKDHTDNGQYTYDIWDFLSVFTDLWQVVQDSKAKDLVWAIIVVGIATLHDAITCPGVDPSMKIASWPSKLRNARAHNQMKLCGPVVVGFNVPEGEAAKNGHDWHITVEKFRFAVCLATMFKRILTAVQMHKTTDHWSKFMRLGRSAKRRQETQ